MLMGVLEPVPTQPETSTVWVKLNGQIISCDSTFSDWFAYTPQELAETAVKGLVIKSADKLSE